GLRLLGAARPRDDAEDQLVLGVVGRVVPPIPPLVIGRVAGVTALLLLVDVRPLLIELNLAGPRGKKPRARRGAVARDRPAVGCSGPPCCGSRRSAAPWPARRCGRRGARRPRRPSPAAGPSGTAGCPCARRSGLCRCGNRAGGTAGSCRAGR